MFVKLFGYNIVLIPEACNAKKQGRTPSVPQVCVFKADGIRVGFALAAPFLYGGAPGVGHPATAPARAPTAVTPASEEGSVRTRHTRTQILDTNCFPGTEVASGESSPSR